MNAWFGYVASVLCVLLGVVVLFFGIAKKPLPTEAPSTNPSAKPTAKPVTLGRWGTMGAGLLLVLIGVVAFMWNSFQARAGKAVYRGAYS